MKRLLRIFKIKGEERVPAVLILLFFAVLNASVIWLYADEFMPISNDHWQLFIRKFYVSGFDPITYCVLTDWTTGYNVYRHPLLAFFAYPLYLLNQLLTALTGVNCAQFVVALVLLFCTVYSYIFLYRIFREVIQLRQGDSLLLSALLFSFGYVTVSLSVPDHFGPSMFMLITALYLSGKCLNKARHLSVVQTVLLFVFTAGISLNNGIKIFLDALFVNGKRFFHPRYLLPAVLFPALLIWGFARWEYHQFVWPKEMERKARKARINSEKEHKAFIAFRDTAGISDSATLKRQFAKEMQRRAVAKYRADHKQPWNMHKGKPMGKGEFARWTDISTPRTATFVENLFGESLQLHEDELLGDTLRHRPIIVKYRWWINYLVEGMLVALFLAGIWFGRRSRFLWMALAGFFFDMGLHMGLGFGINEVYIMTAHWAFVIPISIGFLLKTTRQRWIRLLTAALTTFLFVWNTVLYMEYIYLL